MLKFTKLLHKGKIMRFKKSILTLLSVASVFASQVVELSGDKNYPPYSYTQNNVAKGVYVDIIRRAFEKMPQYDVKFNMMAYKRAIEMTKDGSTVGFFPPYYGKERTSWTKFSTPILAETTIVFSKEEILKNKKTYPEDFYGGTVCLNRGFNQSLLGGDKFAMAINDGKLKLVEGNDNKACLNRVARGIADFYINDQLIDTSMFPEIKKGMDAKGNFGHVGFTLKTENYPFINDLEVKFNEAINQMKKSGEIEKILNNYK